MNAILIVLGSALALACLLWELGLESILVWLACKFVWCISMGHWKPDSSSLGEAGQITVGAITIVVIAAASGAAWWLAR